MTRPARVALLGVLVGAPAARAFGHGDAHRLELDQVLRWWSWQPLVVLPLVASAALYAVGLRALWRGAAGPRAVGRGEAAAFAAGWSALVVALVSPVDALGALLFSAHMAQHELLMLVAAPLLVLGRPLVPMLWALPRRWRERAGAAVVRPWLRSGWRGLTAPLAVFALHGAALWLWHLPRLYEAALRDAWVHALQHLSFFLSAALFFWGLLHGRYGRASYGMAAGYVFATGLHSGALGALLTVAPRVVYPIYEDVTRAWGLDPLEDQQLAGLLMWVPAGIAFTLMGLWLLAGWLAESARRVRHNESE